MPAPIPLDQLLGQKFTRLTILAEASRSNTGLRRVLCLCDCGLEKIVHLGNLRSGDTKSCGCLNKEVAAARHTTHGRRHHLLYGTWNTMLQRCTNPSNPKYKNYAARGITVCARWFDIENYIEDITTLGPKPGPEYSVDRVDNNGNYELSNVRWALPVIQSNNRRPEKYTGKQPTGASGVVGVCATPSGKWQAAINCNGKYIHLGTFSTLQEAAAVREGAEAGLDYQRGRAEH